MSTLASAEIAAQNTFTNTIMVEGTGMCGGCGVNVGGKTMYACVDGPEFDAHEVDRKQLADRLAMYRDTEKSAFEGSRCLIDGLAEVAGGDTP